MLYFVGKFFSHTFLRLFSSYVVLLSIGGLLSAALAWIALPRFWHRLPCDHGKALVKGGMASKGKPTGAGLIIALCLLPALLLAVPPDFAGSWFSSGLAIVALYAIMLFGYLDDRAAKPWGRTRKGLLDLLCCALCAYALFDDGMNAIWVPLTKKVYYMSFWYYMPMAIAILFISVNSLNCSDGVDGLAGSLGIMSLLSLSVLLYLVLGYRPVAEYLLLPHYSGGARWAVLCVTIAGAFAGYLWYNAEPSQVLMGDAGSRMLGLAIGLAVLATGSPLLVLVFAPVVLLDGGTGLVKVSLFKLFKRLGFDIAPPPGADGKDAQPTADTVAPRHDCAIIRLFHTIRFPLHDHCRRKMGWSNAQVLMRFVLLQSFLIPLLFAIFTKVR